MNQHLKDAVSWLEENANKMERFSNNVGAPSTDDWLQVQHIRTIIAAVKSLQAEVEALRRESQ